MKEMTKFFDDSKMFRRLVDHELQEDNVIAKTPMGTELVWKDDIAIISNEIKIGKEKKFLIFHDIFIILYFILLILLR